jgi:hypothetical protein
MEENQCRMVAKIHYLYCKSLRIPKCRGGLKDGQRQVGLLRNLVLVDLLDE